MAHIVNHLDEVIDVDDELLVYLHEMRGERKQVGALHAAFQPDRLPVVSYYHLPASHFVIILEEADILLIHQPEIHGVGIEEQPLFQPLSQPLFLPQALFLPLSQPLSPGV